MAQVSKGCLVGILIAVAGAVEEHDAHGYGGADWRGWSCILGGVLAFILVGEEFGLGPASFACVFTAAFGDRGATLRGSLILALAATAVAAIVFSWAPTRLHRFSVALQPHNLLWSFVGVLIGNVIGVLPGMGIMATISILLPLTFGMPPVAAILILAGIYYGAQYGGAICSILLNLPCHASHAVTCLDGYPMTRAGRGGVALGITMLAAFFGAAFGIVQMIFFAPFLSSSPSRSASARRRSAP